MPTLTPQFPRTVPQLNNNGDTAETLIEDRREVVKHLHRALEALRKITPHGRNYQTVEPERYDEARELHKIRASALEEMHDDIVAEALAILEQTRP